MASQETVHFLSTWWFTARYIISSNGGCQWLAFSDSRDQLRVHSGLHSDYLRCLAPAADQHPVIWSVSAAPSHSRCRSGRGLHRASGWCPRVHMLPLSAPPPPEGCDPSVICAWPGSEGSRSTVITHNLLRMALTCDWEDKALAIMTLVEAVQRRSRSSNAGIQKTLTWPHHLMKPPEATLFKMWIRMRKNGRKISLNAQTVLLKHGGGGGSGVGGC